MKGKWVGLLITLVMIMEVLGCSSGQRLETITVTPATVVFGAPDPTLKVQLTATGTYIHPVATKDITNQVTWSSAVTQVATVNSTGEVNPSTDCGVAGVSATFLTNQPTGNVVTGSTSVTVDGPNPGCPDVTP
jgi:hypothetical protein